MHIKTEGGIAMKTTLLTRIIALLVASSTVLMVSCAKIVKELPNSDARS